MAHQVIEYLATNDIKSLESRGIYARRSTKNPLKFSINYDQIEAKDLDPLAQECRGLVVEYMGAGEPGQPGPYRILAQPFRRFFNLGQGAARQLDWSTVRFEEKLDGTLCIVYWDLTLGKWCCGTRSVPDADIVTNGGWTFSEKFFEVLADNTDRGGPALSNLTNFCTYLFELTGPGNQICLPYDTWQVTLLGCIFTESGDEVRTEFTPIDFPRPTVYSFKSVDEAAAWIQAQPGTSLEGCVAVDAACNRVKIKNQQYLAISRIMQACAHNESIMEIVLAGTADDCIGYLPEPKRILMSRYQDWVPGFLAGLAGRAASIPPTATRKDAALQIKAAGQDAWIGAILDIWTGRYRTAHNWLVAQRQSDNTFRASFVEKLTAIADVETANPSTQSI